MDQPLRLPSRVPIRPIEPTAEGVPLRSEVSSPPSIPDHELFQRIGAGAYGEVWLARNLATGALRAVKIVYRSTFADERPFNREFEGIKKFDAVSRSHPSQLALFHVGRNEAGRYFYYVMELADNRLESRLQAVPSDQVALRSEPVKGREDRLKAGLQTYAAHTPPSAPILNMAASWPRACWRLRWHSPKPWRTSTLMA